MTVVLVVVAAWLVGSFPLAALFGGMVRERDRHPI